MAEKKIISINKQDTPEIEVRKLPYNTEAEQYVIGALLNNNESLNKVSDFLLQDHFFDPLHQKIYQLIVYLYDKGIIANPVTLKNHLQNDEAIEQVGGTNYLLRLSSLAGGIMNLRAYGMIVYNLYVSRQLIEVGQEILEDSYNATGDETATKQIEKPETKLFSLASLGNSETNFAPVRISLNNAIKTADLASKRDRAISGVPSDFKDLDNLLGGFNRSDLIILAARPSMGKTALAMNFALNAAAVLVNEHTKNLEDHKLKQNELEEEPKLGSVGIISLEMSSEQLVTRLLSMETGISAHYIRRGKLSKSNNNDEFKILMEASAKLQELPIFIDDTPSLSISAIRTRARRLKRKYNLEFLVIDYLQLIRGVSKKSQENRVQEISEISMGLKAIAKELNIPVLALSQLSRQVENRTDKHPQLADLRESGSIEQDADIVMFIYREDYYMERTKSGTENKNKFSENKTLEDVKGISEIMIAKNRNGPIGNIKLLFNDKTTKFVDLDPIH